MQPECNPNAASVASLRHAVTQLGRVNSVPFAGFSQESASNFRKGVVSKKSDIHAKQGQLVKQQVRGGVLL